MVRARLARRASSALASWRLCGHT